MPTNLNVGDLSFRYTLISFQDLDHNLFLSSKTPEEILLTVLANFQPHESPTVLDQILRKLDETAKGPLVFQKYIAQLQILVQLRNFQPLLEAAMDNLTKYVNEQNDPFYVKGRNLGFLQDTEEGEARTQLQLIKNLLAETDFSDEKIAHLAGVSLGIVQAVRLKSSSK